MKKTSEQTYEQNTQQRQDAEQLVDNKSMYENWKNFEEQSIRIREKCHIPAEHMDTENIARMELIDSENNR